jgi:hypothetical protein
MFTPEKIKEGLVGAVVRLAVSDDLGRSHPGIRRIAETVLSLTSPATTEALDAHMGRCVCCRDRFIAIAALVEQGMHLGAAVTKELKVPVSPAQALLAGCQ